MPKVPKAYKPRSGELGEFLELYRKFNGNAYRAVKELRPEVNDNMARLRGFYYLNYIDPYKIVFPRGNPNPKNMENTKVIKVSAFEENKKLFEALFQKYGGNGFQAAILAVQELYPNLKKRPAIVSRARKHLVEANFVFDNITALEAKGVNAQKVAEKVSELLNAQKKVTTFNKKGENTVIEEVDASAIDRGLTHALKIGVGGGYAPEKGLLGIKNFSLSKLLDEVEKETPANGQ